MPINYQVNHHLEIIQLAIDVFILEAILEKKEEMKVIAFRSQIKIFFLSKKWI